MYYHAHFVDVRDFRDMIRDVCDICLKLLLRHEPLFVYLQFLQGFQTMRRTTPVAVSCNYAKVIVNLTMRI